VSGVEADVWITMTELRRRFHRVLRDVERGLAFTIVRRGKPVARLIPFVAVAPSR
jgi:prevent-host-death family protein